MVEKGRLRWASLLGATLAFGVLMVNDAQAQSSRQVGVTFEVVADYLKDDATVCVTGSHVALGNWRPDGVRLKKTGDGVWRAEVQLPAGFPLEYKFTLGTWECEAADDHGMKFQNFSVTTRQGVVVRHKIHRWTDADSQPIQGQVTGTVRIHRQMKPDGLPPRDVIVWLPPGYASGSERYPVLYMHDGQNLFDPRTSAFEEDWELDETCTEFIEAGKISPLIIVGVYNTAQRTEEYTPGEQGDRYSEWFVNTLKPFIDRTYRTKADRHHTAIGGSSAGGICAFRMAWEYPRVFGQAICLSPAFQFESQKSGLQIDYVKQVQEQPLPEPLPRLMIRNGRQGLDVLLQPGVDAMVAALEQKGLVRGRDLIYSPAEDGRHSEASWAKQMRWVLPRAFPNNETR